MMKMTVDSDSIIQSLDSLHRDLEQVEPVLREQNQ